MSDKFRSCGKCDEGWVRVYEGRTAGRNQIDPKDGAVKRCECFQQYLGAKQ